MTLIEVMVASAVGMIVMLAMTSFMVYQNNAVTGLRTTASRDQLTNNLSKLSAYSGALSKSAEFAASLGFPAQDANFIHCLKGDQPNGCTAGSGTFTLTDQTGVPVAGPSETNAAVYDTWGKYCGSSGGGGTYPTPDARCPIIAYTSYVATCASASPCNQASSIAVTYTIKQPNAVAIALGRLQPVTNTLTSIAPFSGSGGLFFH